MRLGRLGATAAISGLLAAAAFPFIVLFPEPPAFGPEALLLLATFAIVASLATAWRAEHTRRRRILQRAGTLFAITTAAILTNITLRGNVPVPIIDVLPRLLGLHGEDIDAAILFEVWCELWLVWAVLLGVPVWVLLRRHRPAPIPPGPWHQPVRSPPWNAATVLLFVVGWCAMAATLVEGHRTAAFLTHADHTEGVIANNDAHPLIRFTAADGTAVTFRQNGGISRAVGAPVPVAYDTTDPAGTAEADTFFVAWGNTAGLAWLGLGFTLFPFFGARAAFGRR